MNRNLIGQTAKGGLIGIAGLGMVYTIPFKAGSNIRILIIDNKDKNIAFYNHSLKHSEPIIKNERNMQLRSIFKAYFID